MISCKNIQVLCMFPLTVQYTVANCVKTTQGILSSHPFTKLILSSHPFTKLKRLKALRSLNDSEHIQGLHFIYLFFPSN